MYPGSRSEIVNRKIGTIPSVLTCCLHAEDSFVWLCCDWNKGEEKKYSLNRFTSIRLSYPAS